MKVKNSAGALTAYIGAVIAWIFLSGFISAGADVPRPLVTVAGFVLFTGIAGLLAHAAFHRQRQRDKERIRYLEKQLAEAQRFQTTGQLVGGVVHDFNNMLMIIHGYCQFIESALGESHSVGESIRAIKGSVTRCANLTRQLLSFVGRRENDPQVVNLSEAVTDLKKLIGNILPPSINLNLHADDALWPVKVDPSHIDQIVLNLVINASDAMSDGGMISVKTANVKIEERQAREMGTIEPGEYVLLSVSDTGIGMDEHIREQIFEPLFTTKEVGKGTGLGLAMVYHNVKRSGGEIFVDSHPRLGTTFSIYLPRAGELDIPAGTLSHFDYVSARQRQAPQETILFMETDESVRSLLEQCLKQYGYDVIAPRTPMEALKICESGKTPISALVTDIAMVSMNGSELAAGLHARNPRAAVIYIADYYGQSVDADLEMGGRSIVLPKPFSGATLAQQLRISLALSPPEARIGTRLVRLGYMDPEALEDVLRRQESGDRRRFGEIAVRCGYVTDEQITEAFSQPEDAVVHHPRVLIGEYFIRKGCLTRSQVYEIVRIQRQSQEKLFGRIAIAIGYITDAELQSYIADYERMSENPQAEEGDDSEHVSLRCPNCGHERVVESSGISSYITAAVLTGVNAHRGPALFRCPNAGEHNDCDALEVHIQSDREDSADDAPPLVE